MAVRSLYHDFFEFLDGNHEYGIWEAYRRLYWNPHREFFQTYWASFDYFDSDQIARRVEKIRKGDYGHLRALVFSRDPVALAEEALQRSRALAPLDPEPDVYLFVGFFSADGKTLVVQGNPAIAIGLERFKDFRDLPLLVAHEYGHCLQRGFPKDSEAEENESLFSFVTSEGLAVLFTEAVYPEIPRYRHLFIPPERLRWCEENRDVLEELAGPELGSKKLVSILFGPGDPEAGIPPRVGYYLAREMVGQCLAAQGAEEFGRNSQGFERVFRRFSQKHSKNFVKIEG